MIDVPFQFEYQTSTDVTVWPASYAFGAAGWLCGALLTRNEMDLTASLVRSLCELSSFVYLGSERFRRQAT